MFPLGFAVAAKNVILAGVKAVVLHDTEKVQLRDLGAQFYLTPDDVGSNRASACEAKLQELNSAVAVSSSDAEVSDSFLGQFHVSPVRSQLRLKPFQLDPPLKLIGGASFLVGVFSQQQLWLHQSLSSFWISAWLCFVSFVVDLTCRASGKEYCSESSGRYEATFEKLPSCRDARDLARHVVVM